MKGPQESETPLVKRKLSLVEVVYQVIDNHNIFQQFPVVSDIARMLKAE